MPVGYATYLESGKKANANTFLADKNQWMVLLSYDDASIQGAGPNQWA